MPFAQKLIALADSTCSIALGLVEADSVTVALPDDLRLLRPPERGPSGWTATVAAGGRRTAHREATVTARIGGQAVTEIVATRIFGRRELFLCVVTTSNFHWGFAPQNLADLDAGHGSIDGDPLVHHGHAYASSRYMAQGAHAAGLPVTWVIDGVVAEHAAAELTAFHRQHGDDLALMPSSLWYGNSINFNLERSPAQAERVLRGTSDTIVNACAAQGWRPELTVAGIDQWVGSLGTSWIAAARAMGLRGVWGMAFDHASCDGSMFHEGCPWDAYRVSADNFRFPGAGPGPWAFPWTSRDLVNAMLDYPTRSVWYSTDPDDIEHCGIRAAQPDYFDRLIRHYSGNLGTSDFACFVVHNEDHDAHRTWAQAYLERFYQHLPPGTVPATLDEVARWLDLRFADGSHPAQLLELDDPLTCHAQVVATLTSTTSRGGQGNDFVPPACWTSLDGHNPSVVCQYDLSSRWMAQQGRRVPDQYIDYTRRDGFSETGATPKELLPVLSAWSERDEGSHVAVSFQADRPFARLPLLFWHRPDLRGERSLPHVEVVHVDVVVGANTVRVPKRQAAPVTLPGAAG